MHTYLYTRQPITYDGRQLSPHWLYRQFDLLGDAIAAFTGPCRVELTEMVDLADVKAAAPIYSPLMLHCIAEFFQTDLELAVYRQRLLIVTAKELLEEVTGQRVQRQGDDLYLSRPDGTPGKLSVSIATVSLTSTLIHTGFNIETEGTPVPTVGLAELGVDIPGFAAELPNLAGVNPHQVENTEKNTRRYGNTGCLSSLWTPKVWRSEPYIL